MKFIRIVKSASRPVKVDELIDLINQYKTKTIKIRESNYKYFTLKVESCSKENKNSIRIYDKRGIIIVTQSPSFVIEDGDTLKLIFEDFMTF